MSNASETTSPDDATVATFAHAHARGVPGNVQRVDKNNPRKGGVGVNAGQGQRPSGPDGDSPRSGATNNPRKGGVHRFRKVLGGSGAVLVVVGGAATQAKSTQN